ncbi:MAG TPA: response regulator transcription factor [Thermoanaerobaculia bacterium]|nr:response regulator transcription factor [Thermoanaerobaculia bacterium]
MRVLLADDHRLVRAGIRSLLSEMPDVVEILEARDGAEAVEMVTAHHPDLVLMDVSMPPGMNGIEALERIRRISPQTRVVILSMHRDPHFVHEALRAGAAGYLLKSDELADLEKAVRAVACGRIYISPVVASATEAGKRNGGPAARLTPRQREVLRLIAQGLTSRQIALQLRIHIKTVESHRTELMRRLGIHDVAGLVRYAIRHGLAPAE